MGYASTSLQPEAPTKSKNRVVFGKKFAVEAAGVRFDLKQSVILLSFDKWGLGKEYVCQAGARVILGLKV